MDLSKLLSDVYAHDHAPAPASPPVSTSDTDGPEWADEARLDEAFAQWVPGPPDDAPAAEREMAETMAGPDDATPSERADALGDPGAGAATEDIAWSWPVSPELAELAGADAPVPGEATGPDLDPAGAGTFDQAEEPLAGAFDLTGAPPADPAATFDAAGDARLTFDPVSDLATFGTFDPDPAPASHAADLAPAGAPDPATMLPSVDATAPVLPGRVTEPSLHDAPAEAPRVRVAPEPVRAWSRSDDDVFPSRNPERKGAEGKGTERKGGRGRLFSRR